MKSKNTSSKPNMLINTSSTYNLKGELTHQTPSFNRLKEKSQEVAKKPLANRVKTRAQDGHRSAHQSSSPKFISAKAVSVTKNSVASNYYATKKVENSPTQASDVRCSYNFPMKPASLTTSRSRNGIRHSHTTSVPTTIKQKYGKQKSNKAQGSQLSTYYQTSIKSPKRLQGLSNNNKRWSGISGPSTHSRNSAVNSKHRTMDTDDVAAKSEDVTPEPSDVQKEAQVQVPTRFKSRQSMMDFKGKLQYCILLKTSDVCGYCVFIIFQEILFHTVQI